MTSLDCLLNIGSEKEEHVHVYEVLKLSFCT